MWLGLKGLTYKCGSCSQDLIKQTPEDHPDCQLLKDMLKSTQDFLASISGDQRDGPVSDTTELDCSINH